MKKLIILIAVLNISLINSQAFIGSGDNKLQVGASLQENASGVNVSYDLGVGENISLGFSSTYALGVDEILNADFLDRFDFRARFNANLGNVINVDENFDVYPGLSFGIKNFGGHLGVRYFFTQGFGVYTEFNVPFAKYNNEALTPAEKIHNQFTVNLGAAFNL